MRYDREGGRVVLDAAELCAAVLGGGSAELARRLREGAEVARLYASERQVDAVASPVLASELEAENTRVSLTASVPVLAGDIPIFGRVVGARELHRPLRGEYTGYIKCCALLVCRSRGAERITVALVSRQSDAAEPTVSRITYERRELEAFAAGLLSCYAFRITFLVAHESSVRPSAAEVVFPYADVREGQDELMRKGFFAIKRGRRLFAQAPTGIGKTISTLYPAVRAFGRGLCDKIFYLTAKNATAREAYHAAGRLFEAGARLRTVMLSAKEQMCAKGAGGVGRQCDAGHCRFLRGYRDRVESAIQELLAVGNGYYPQLICQVAAKHGICPYELSLDLSELCDIIICDYNYLFDPLVYLRRYFERPGDFGEYVFLVDEAHNLADRARAMYSVTLTLNHVRAFYESLPGEEGELRGVVAPLVPTLEGLRGLCRDTMHTDGGGEDVGYYINRQREEPLCAAVLSAAEGLSAWLRTHREHELYEITKSFSADIRKFAVILDHYDQKFVTYVECAGSELSVSLNCLDPSEILSGCLDKGRGAILFSATLAPLPYFVDILGGGKRAMTLSLPSPYDPENLCLAAVDTVSTRFDDREGREKRVATLIAAAVSPKAGNYIAYFPSYSYLQRVHEAFVKKYPKVKTLVQSRGMSGADREQFMAFFREDENKLRVGFCVLGGSFSEGIDLPGSRLIGTVIVGVGLPGFSSERNIMRDHFENRYENGFDYAYTYPGMNSVLQAAGRVIRREDDRGIVVLIDDRYATPTYQRLFPEHWKHLKYAGNSSSLAEIARRFWEKS